MSVTKVVLLCRRRPSSERRVRGIKRAVTTRRHHLLLLAGTARALRFSGMSGGAAVGLAELAGSGSTSEELRACKIGGCCGKDTPKLGAADVESRLGALPLWALSTDGTTISREFTAKNWGAAMAFLNSLSELAEEEGHHPDVHLTGWRNVRVDMSTHAIGGLSMPDLVLAAKLDAIPVVYSPKWLRESGVGSLLEAEEAKKAKTDAPSQ